MGSLTVDEILKLLKVLDKSKVLKKKRKKRRQNKKKYLTYNKKSISDHMKGNIITGEHLRAIQDNNNSKLKEIENSIYNNSSSKLKEIENSFQNSSNAKLKEIENSFYTDSTTKLNVLEDSINDFKNQVINYLTDYNNRLIQMENNLSNIPNQSLSRTDVKKYSNQTDNLDVVVSDPDFHSESSLPSNQTDIRNFLIQKPSDTTNTAYLTEDTKPKPEEPQKDNESDNKSVEIIFQKDDENGSTNSDENKDVDSSWRSIGSHSISPEPEDVDFIDSDNENIIEEVEDPPNIIEDVTPIEEKKDDESEDTREEIKYNKLLNDYLNNESFKNAFDDLYLKDNAGNITKRKVKNKNVSPNMTDEEKKLFYEITKHFKIKVGNNIQKKGTAYNILYKYNTQLFVED